MKFEDGIFYHGASATPIKHIVRIDVRKQKVPSIKNIAWAFAATPGGCVIGFATGGGPGPGQDHDNFFAISIFGMLLTLLLLVTKSFKSTYAVVVSTTSGQTLSFVNQNEEFINQVAEVFKKVIVDERKESLRAEINIENRTIGNITYVDNSVANITNNYHFDIVNSYYEGVSRKDLEFLNNQFKEGMQELAKLIKETNDNNLNLALETFRKEVNAEKPDSGRMNAYWERIKQCSEGMDIYHNVISAGTLVSTAISAFM